MPSTYYKLILREWAEVPGIVQSLNSDGDLGPGTLISVNDQVEQLALLNACLPAGWGLRLGELFSSAVHGPVSAALASAPTFAEALNVIERFGHLRTPFLRYQKRATAKHLAINVVNAGNLPPDAFIPILQASSIGIPKALEGIVGNDIHKVAVEFSFAKPNVSAEYKTALKGRVTFEHEQTRFLFPREWENRHSPLADPLMFSNTLDHLASLARQVDEGAPFAHQVVQIIAASSDAIPAAESMASQMNMSARTFIRKLQHCGTSYSELVDEHRRETSRRLMTTPGHSISDIAYRLGYSDVSNFSRAFKRWFGVSPGQFRRTKSSVQR